MLKKAGHAVTSRQREAHSEMETVSVVHAILAKIDRYVTKRRARIIDLFRAVDSGGDGTVTAEELREGLAKIGIRCTNDEFKLLTETFDPDGSGEIEFSEFADAVKIARGAKKAPANATATIKTAEPVANEKYDVADIFEMLKRGQKQSLFFRGFTDADLQTLAKSCAGTIEFTEGEEIVPAGGRPDGWVGLLAKGCLSLMHTGGASAGDRIARFGPGDWVCESDFLSGVSVESFCADFAGDDSASSGHRMWNRGKQAREKLLRPVHGDHIALTGDFDDVLRVRSGVLVCWNQVALKEMEVARTGLVLKLYQSMVASEHNAAERRPAGQRHDGSGAASTGGRASAEAEATDQDDEDFDSDAEPSSPSSGKGTGSGQKGGTAAVIRQLKKALKHEKAKWKRKFETLKEVLHEQHETKLHSVISKHKMDFAQQMQDTHKNFEQEKNKWGALSNAQGKKGDRENLALRAKLARLERELKQHAAHAEKVAEQERLKGATARAKRRWGLVRSDMQRSAEAKDKFADIMRAGTVHALRTVRMEAMSALAETQDKLLKASADAQSNADALQNATEMQEQMNKQINLLQNLVARTESEKKKLDEKATASAKEGVRRRFAAAKVKALQRRREEALQAARQENVRLAALLSERNEQLELEQTEVLSLQEELANREATIRRIKELAAQRRGWMVLQGAAFGTRAAVLERDMESTRVEAAHASRRLDRAVREIEDNEADLEDLRARLTATAADNERLVVVLEQANSHRKTASQERREARQLVVSLSSHANSLQHAVSAQVPTAKGFGGSRAERLAQSAARRKAEEARRAALVTMPTARPEVLKSMSRHDRDGGGSGRRGGPGTPGQRVAVVARRTSPRRQRATLRHSAGRAGVLLFLDIDPLDSGNLTGWALSQNYSVEARSCSSSSSSSDDRDGGGFLPGELLLQLKAVVWRATAPVDDADQKRKTASRRPWPESSSSSEPDDEDFDEEAERRREAEAAQAKQNARAQAMFGALRRLGVATSAKAGMPPVVVVHSADDPGWQDWQCAGVVCLEAPLRMRRLSAVLAAASAARGGRRGGGKRGNTQKKQKQNVTTPRRPV